MQSFIQRVCARLCNLNNNGVKQRQVPVSPFRLVTCPPLPSNPLGFLRCALGCALRLEVSCEVYSEVLLCTLLPTSLKLNDDIKNKSYQKRYLFKN